MKQIKNVAKNPVVLISLEIVAAVVISILVVILVGLPAFSSWREHSQKTTELKQKLEKINANINILENTDEEEIKLLEERFGTILPSDTELLKFFTLASKVASASGVTFSAGQAEISDKPPPTASPVPTPGSSPTPTTGGTSSGSSGQATTPPAGSAQQNQVVADIEVKLSFLGSFSNTYKLIENFDKTDRVSLLTGVLFNKEEDSSRVAATLTFTLPTSAPPASVDAETASLLTNLEKEQLNEILDSITITVSPANQPLGRPNPFN